MELYQNFIPDPMAISLENSWSHLSKQIQQLGVSGVFCTPIQIQNALNQAVQIGNVERALQQAVLALMLYICKNPKPIIRTPFPVAVGADEQCDPYGEPTTNIIGRDGQCVDVNGDHYNDGDATMLLECKIYFENDSK
ncbi:ricin [Artemisia annua]|uniref:Ricin n=1 Tax=Artemisia annua TaxID=35608 RepID=A0A2U1M419_ARTAN|nr:ricin [Artemisia annua]